MLICFLLNCRVHPGTFTPRVSFETNFDSKQPKLEPKLNVCFGCLASILKQRVSMFWLNRNKQKTNQNSLIGSIFWSFFRKFRVVSVCFGLFRNSLFQLFLFYTKTECFNVLIVPKQTEDQPKQFEREHIWVFFRIFWVVLVCFETVLFVSVV